MLPRLVQPIRRVDPIVGRCHFTHHLYLCAAFRVDHITELKRPKLRTTSSGHPGFNAVPNAS